MQQHGVTYRRIVGDDEQSIVGFHKDEFCVAEIILRDISRPLCCEILNQNTSPLRALRLD